MTRVETSVVIQRPVEEVFEYVIQPENLSEWAPGYLQATSTSEGSIRVGSTSTRVTDFGGRRSESEHVVTEFEPNARISVRTKSGPLEINELFEVEAVEDGTRVTIAEEVTTSLIMKPAAWAFALMAGRNVPKYGVALKEHLEKTDRQGEVGAA